MGSASEPAGPVGMVELEGGPLDGRRLEAELDVEVISLLTPSGVETYAATGRTTHDGLPVLAWRPSQPGARPG